MYGYVASVLYCSETFHCSRNMRTADRRLPYLIMTGVWQARIQKLKEGGAEWIARAAREIFCNHAHSAV